LLAGPHSICLCRARGLRIDAFVKPAFWKRLGADDHFLYGGSDKHNFRYEQHAELDSSRSDEYCHRARDIHVSIGKRFNKHEPNGDDHLHTHSNQCRWFDHVHANRYRKHGRQTTDQLLHSWPHKYQFGFQQHAELGDNRGDQPCYHARDIYVHLREWFDEREPNGDDHLHADRDQ